MKTITMDYDTYIQELQEARFKGLSSSTSFRKSLSEIIEILDEPVTRENYYATVRKLSNLIRDLETVEKP